MYVELSYSVEIREGEEEKNERGYKGSVEQRRA